MKRIICILLAISLGMTYSMDLSAQKKREPIKAGYLIDKGENRDSSGRKLSQRLFISKGEVGTGIQFSYLDLSSSDSEFLMLIQNLNAHGTMFSVAPTISYAVKDNAAIGLKIKYSNTSAGISEADFSLLSDDLALNIENVKGYSNAIQSAVFYRSYVGLDNQGRFGLFTDISLAYSHNKTSFSYNSESMDSYTLANKLKLGIHPGLEVFVMNNISTHFSIGIGGISYTNTKYFKNNEFVGQRNVSKARFMLDVTDISMGMTIHI